MRRILPAIIIGLALVAPLASSASGLEPGLALRIRGMAPDEQIKVLVVLADRPDLPALKSRLDRTRAGRAQRHRTVMRNLREAAARSQGPLLDELAAMRDRGEIAGFTPHWLINAVVVLGKTAAIRSLALRPDVDRIEADLVASAMRPVAEAPVSATEAALGVGTTPGMTMIGADRVWREMGFTGKGVLIGSIDTGVDGTHPALRDRWRGNFAPVSECWLDAAGLGHPLPDDDYRHGTHIMGTLAGLAPGDSIGVAPGALWIASNATNQDASSEFDNDILNSLEWLADPDGDPQTVDDVPDVVQNSWGIYDGMSGVVYPPCDSRWWDAMDACEAAGIVLVWSAGNEGPDPFSLRSPADRASTPLNAFSVGSVDFDDPVEVSYFSSRGPSECDSVSIKPEVVAPGNPIYSSVPGGGYWYFSGTSMAGPHVAGIAALIRDAAPDLGVDQIKQIILDTAVDLGPPGEDNDSGFGLVDAWAAVSTALGPAGTVTGRLTDHVTGEPVPEGVVTVGDQTVHADADGRYSIILAAGSRTLECSGFGFTPTELSVPVTAGSLITLDAALQPGATARLHGKVYDPAGTPIAGAVLTALDTPVPPTSTGPDGSYEFLLPPGTVYMIQAIAEGLSARVIAVEIAGDTELDFHLPRSIENFETGGFSLFPWESGGDAGWLIDDLDPYEGAFSARSGPIVNNQSSLLQVTLSFVRDDTLSFRLRVSTETGFDVLSFRIDGQEAASWTGELPWQEQRFALTAGEHTLSWLYVKDEAGRNGGDSAWLDLIRFPDLGEPPTPEAALSPSTLGAGVAPGRMTERLLLLENRGQAPLTFDAVLEIAAPSGGGDPVPVESGGRGGPDEFGYWWIDDGAFGGPVYDWIEISATGQVASFPLAPPDELDSDMTLPIPLGFTFPFYGVDHTDVRICTNGFLSFGTYAINDQNVSIPNTNIPNDMIAPMWSDLRVGFWTGTEGPVYWWSDPENGRFVVQYQNAKHFASGLKTTFEVILYENGSILCQYADVPFPDEDAFYTVGIENPDGTDGLQAAFDQPILHDGTALLFTTTPPPAPWLRIEPSSGVIPPLGSVEMTVTFDAADLQAGSYIGTVLVGTDDPDRPEISVPAQLTVDPLTGAGPGDPPVAFALRPAAPNPFNPRTTIRFDVPAQGAPIELRIYDAAGRLSRTLLDQRLPGGRHAAVWDGRDDAGRPAPSGIYFVRLKAPGFLRTTKIALVK